MKLMKRLNFAIFSTVIGSLLAVSCIIFQSQAFAAKEVAEIFHSQLTSVQRQTNITIRLPSQLPSGINNQQIYVSSQADRNSYQMSLASKPNCGANACFIGYFSAKRGDRPSFDQTVRLANGIIGYYKPLTCGASCSPPTIQWIQDGILYSIQMRVSRDPDEAMQVMIELANSSIANAPYFLLN